MSPSPSLTEHPAPRPRRLRRDDGWAIALTTLLILPILAFVSLGVDLGAWYARAQQIQQAADAAALAAAPLTPDPVATRNAALDSLRKNHINCTDFGGPIRCDMFPLTGSEIAYRVEISDPSAPQYFSKPFRSAVEIGRKATAERLHPIPMGSPNNYLGTNQLIGTTTSDPPRENYWLAISGKCASKEQGERRMALTDANWSSGNYRSCQDATTVANTEYDPGGYTYVMNLGANFNGTVHLEVYDPVLCNNSSVKESPDDYGGDQFQFRYIVKGKANNPANAPTLNTWVPSNTTGCSSYQNQWVTLYQFVNPSKGQYYLQIQDPTASPGVNTNRTSNQFAIRARYDGSLKNAGDVAPSAWAKCSTINDPNGKPAYRADCPQIHGYKDMGVYAGIAGSQASFYLTSVGPDYNGRKMEVTLWDPGEGASSIELLNPAGNAVSFDWASIDCGTTGVSSPSGGCTGTNTSLSVSGNGTQPGPNRLSTSKYNDRPIKLTVQLPSNIATAYGGNTWWKIRYTAGTSPTDRTTWSVQIPGDPVRLVPTVD
jgi:hypothetical protein